MWLLRIETKPKSLYGMWFQQDGVSCETEWNFGKKWFFLFYSQKYSRSISIASRSPLEFEPVFWSSRRNGDMYLTKLKKLRFTPHTWWKVGLWIEIWYKNYFLNQKRCFRSQNICGRNILHIQKKSLISLPNISPKNLCFFQNEKKFLYQKK